jgi:hypothetical protein
VSSLKLEYGAPVTIKRPNAGLWAGKLVHAKRKTSQRSKRAQYELIAARKAKGIRVMGWNKVVEQHFLTIPRSEERFGRVPSFSRSTKEARVAAAKRRRKFLSAYYVALRNYIGGMLDVFFPEGTWFMKKRFDVSCCPLPDS